MKLSDSFACYWQQNNIKPTKLDVNQESFNQRRDCSAKPYVTVSISDVSKRMRITKDTASPAPNIRIEKVKKIKQQIEKGTYMINVDQIAERILNSIKLI
ncbi:MAG: flagellar biosynthesis anti-sigma factor FlgM [Desulfobacterales bacterium]|nr:flagellar biosynthesis anti-sigma factor FlgM [Desulfobacterales bacterium]